VDDSPKSKRLASDSVTREPPRRASLLIGVLLVALVVVAYGFKTNPGLAQMTGKPSEEALMKAGLGALYTQNDPATAALRFREVLALNPKHYGATFQLATALDRAGRPDEARGYWEKMVPMAEAAKDEETAATARARLQAKPGPASDEATLMKTGLHDLYTRNDPGAAADQFRKVLERNPTHYGATYQLATALDRGGKPTEAHPLWEKVLKMAEGYKDKATADTARARLAQNP
jgi:Tfp pilus assembly protein PilF